MSSAATSPIVRVIEPKIKDLGEFSVRRALPVAGTRSIGPWVFFDHFGPATMGPGHGMNVRPHPHIGLATVTYLFEGTIWHRDSLGSDLDIHPGAVNLMVAGSGIVHSERTRPEHLDGTFDIHGLQLWHALPENEEERDASFHHYPADDIPEASLSGGGTARVMMGEAFGVTSPVRTFSEILYYEVDLPEGASVALPATAEHGLYVAQGRVEIADHVAETFTMNVLASGAQTVTAHAGPARFAVVGGAPLGERHIRWNFVSSSVERIQQAAEQWRAGEFPTVPGDETEYIPLPKEMIF